MPEQPEFVTRMVRELHDLREKTNALQSFLDGAAIKVLSETDQALLAAQHAAMSTYEHILFLRLTPHLPKSS